MKMVQKIFLYWVILKKAENILKIRFSHSNLVKILDFRKSIETPPWGSPMVFFGWKPLRCRCFDVYLAFGWFLLDFETPSSVLITFPVISMAILSFLVRNTGSEASRSFPDHFSWLKICLKHSQMVFGRLLAGFFFIWKLFALTTFICYVYIGDFEILGVETLRREFSGEKFGTWVAWKFRPDSLLLKCCPNMPWDGAKEFPPSINFWKKLEQFESTIFTL